MPSSGTLENMANPEHLAKLRDGTEVWNRWRREHPAEQPWLDLANLHGKNLGGADLRSARLVGADLQEANLSGANLFQADLIEADLREAYLTGADLREANFALANLGGADLGGANLSETLLLRTNFSGANLCGADVTSAILLETVFSDTDLTDMIGLDSCGHRGPSTIDFRTLAKSWPLPLSFLRGCGLPDTLNRNSTFRRY